MKIRKFPWKDLAPQLLFGAMVVPPLIACSLMERPSLAPAFHQSEEGRRSFVYEKVGPHPRAAGSLRPVYFALDSSRLTGRARKILARHAAWLKRNPSVQIQIEGFCDERGSDDYNYQLGAKRARRARNYLKRLGVAQNRMTTLSHGRIEGNYGPNRRTSFILIYPPTQTTASR